MNRFSKIALLSGALLIAAVPVLFAAERLSEPFASPEGGLPDGWTAALTSPISVAEVRKMPSGNGNALLIQRTPEGVGSAAVFYSGGGSGDPSAVLNDFTATVTLSFEQRDNTSSTTHGILLRASRIDYKRSKGYYVSIRPMGNEAGLTISRDPKSHVEEGERIAFTPISGLKSNRDYILTVTAKGSRIEGELWSVDAAGAKKDQLGLVETDDAPENGAGLFALRSGFGNSGPIGAWYRSLHLSTPAE